MTDCLCGPGPVGGRGWRADCPQHNVRELLKAPPEFDPTTIRERIETMTLNDSSEYDSAALIPSATQNPPDYSPGLGELIRSNRTYIGLVHRGMAKQLGLDRRDYQRIENGDDDCPPGLLDKIDEVVANFETDVTAVIEAACRELGIDPDNIPEKIPGRVKLLVSTDPREEWQRCVVNRATIESGVIMPYTIDGD